MSGQAKGRAGGQARGRLSSKNQRAGRPGRRPRGDQGGRGGKGSQLGMYAMFVLAMTLILLVALGLALFFVGLLANLGYTSPAAILVAPFVSAFVLGVALASRFGKRGARPIDELIDGMRRVAGGDFDVRLSERARGPIGEANADFNAMVAALGQTEMLREDFVANVSHEFKSPLTSIQGYATLLQEPGLDDERRRRYTEAILDSSRRLSRMSGTILELARLENGGERLARGRFSLDEQLRHVAAEFVPVWGERGVAFDIDLPEGEVDVAGSEELLAEAWQNLLDNATKFTPDGGRVSVRLRAEGGRALVSVSDTGCGMGEQVLAHAFDKFYQGDKSHAREGNGLGLALVKEVVERHGGRVRAQSRPGAGSTFTAELPLG